MDKATTPRGDVAGAVNVVSSADQCPPFFLFLGQGARGWQAGRSDAVTSFPPGLTCGLLVSTFSFCLSLSLSRSLVLVPSLPLTCCSPARPQTHTVGEIDSGG